MQDARAGDEEAARRLVEQYGASMMRTAWRVLGSYGGSDAEDVVQDAWVAAWSTDALPTGDTGAWLRSITARKALDRIRSTARRSEQPLEDVSLSVRIDDRVLNVLTLRKGLATLKPIDRAALEFPEDPSGSEESTESTESTETTEPTPDQEEDQE